MEETTWDVCAWWRGTIKMALKIQGVDWIQLAQNRVLWWAVMNRVMNPRLPQNAGQFFY
jgi:hypothetical protein